MPTQEKRRRHGSKVPCEADEPKLLPSRKISRRLQEGALCNQNSWVLKFLLLTSAFIRTSNCQQIYQILPARSLVVAMPTPEPPLRPHFSTIDTNASSPTDSSSSMHKYREGRQNLTILSSRDDRVAPPVSRKREIQQRYRQLSTIGFTSLVMGSWELLLTTNSLSLRNGGLAGLLWASIWAHIGQFFVVLSLAEMSSMVPISGGQYRFVTAFAPRRSVRLLSYCSGWICSIGWQARFTLHCYVIANLIQSLAQPHMAATRWQTHLLMILIALIMSGFNALAAGHLTIAEGVC